MKHLAPALAAVLLAASQACPRTNVQVLEIHTSTQKPFIIVLKDSVPEQGARLTVFAKDGKQKLILTTDSHGAAKLPHLRSGTYTIVASTSPTLRAELCSNIGAGHQKNPSTFAMQLLEAPPPLPTFEERLAAAEQAPGGAPGRTFSGVVVDPTGAVIPHVSIAIYCQRAGGAWKRRKLFSDPQGRFSFSSSPGRYTAVFSAQGFGVQFVAFEIARGAPDTALHVKLMLGDVTESVRVARQTSNH